MTQAEFVNEWKDELLGKLCWGVFADGNKHPLAQQMTGQYILSNVEFTTDFLKRVWQSMQPKPQPAPLPQPAKPPEAKPPEPPVRPTTAPAGPAGPPPQGRR